MFQKLKTVIKNKLLNQIKRSNVLAKMGITRLNVFLWDGKGLDSNALNIALIVTPTDTEVPVFTPLLTPTILNDPKLFARHPIDAIPNGQYRVISDSKRIEPKGGFVTDTRVFVNTPGIGHEVVVDLKRDGKGSTPYECQTHELFIAGAVKASDIVIVCGVIAPTPLLFALTVDSLVWEALLRSQTEVLGVFPLKS